MGAYKYIKKAFQEEAKARSPEYKKRLMAMRRQATVERIEKPTNISRARTLGYKAKQGFVTARVRVKRGSGLHSRPRKGRRPKRMGVRKLKRAKSKQRIAEERANRKFPNLEVLNSYWIAQDGTYKWYEVIMVDALHPSIANDSDVNWVISKAHKGRAFRGLTSAGKKGRGLGKKGRGTEKTRPGIKARGRKGK